MGGAGSRQSNGGLRDEAGWRGSGHRSGAAAAHKNRCNGNGDGGCEGKRKQIVYE